MTPLRQRMLEELQRRNYSESTIRGYIHAIKQFAEHFHKSPELLGPEEVRQFQLYLLNERKLAPSTVEIRMSALRFLYWKVLKRRDTTFDDLVFPKKPAKLPVVLSPEEVKDLIDGAASPTHYTILMVLYGTGMRRTETSRLMVSDIDSDRMVIHIHKGKGGKDRDVPLTPRLLSALRQYWLFKRPKTYLFPSPESKDGADEEPISDKTVWYAVRDAAKRAGITKKIGPHTLRHSFATHLMESGADLRTIQLLLGHASIEDTTIYVHLSQRHLKAAANPLEGLPIGPYEKQPPSETEP